MLINNGSCINEGDYGMQRPDTEPKPKNIVFSPSYEQTKLENKQKTSR